MTDLAINLSLFLVDQIIQFTTNEANSHGNIAQDIRAVKLQLERMQDIIVRNSAAEEDQEALEKSLRLVGYEIQHVLDRIMLHEPHHFPTSKLLSKAYQLGHSIWHWWPIRGIQEDIQEIRNELGNIHPDLPNPSNQNRSPRTELLHHLSELPKDAVILGIKVSKQNLISQLINNTRERNLSAVVVVGPPGSGKTALVNGVYTDDQVRRHFGSSILSARLSRRFDVDAVLSLLLSQTSQRRGKKTALTGNVAINLKNNLQGKRYLVILDDVWDGNHWEAIIHALPDDSNGSRVVITTTKEDVAYSINASGSHNHKIEGLKEGDAWDLFCIKAFGVDKRTCPSDLEVSSREIVRKCEGSPLAISEVGDFLAKESRLPTEWAKVAEKLRAVMENNRQLSALNNSIQHSYDDLNANLKSCLLYFSLFPEGCDIERERLIRLWVAERFVNQTGEKSAEKVAEEYLKELIRRNLVVAKEDFDGRVKSCRVNHFLSYFLTFKSRKEDFADVLDRPSMKAVENARRLLITDAFYKGGREKVKGKFYASILFRGVSLPHVKEICSQVKFLKVLDFQGAPLQSFPECVVDLGLLRYLSLRGSKGIAKVPSSIKKLRYLEFLDLKNTAVTSLPKEICLLEKLQHLLVYLVPENTDETFQSVQGMKMSGDIGSLCSLRKLTLLKAGNHLRQLGKLRQLQKLGLIELRSSDGRDLFESLAKMENLSVLDLRSVDEMENLDLDYSLPSNNLKRVYLKGPLVKLPGWLTSLTSLVRLHLKWSRLTFSSIDELQGLNALTELHLVDAFTGDKLVFQKGAFESLKVLQIADFAELSTLEIPKGSMCKLEKLVLCKCKQLKTVRIHSISELKELVLFDMPVELPNRLRRSGLDQSRIKVNNSSSDAAEFTGLEHNGILHDLVLPLVQSLKRLRISVSVT